MLYNDIRQNSNKLEDIMDTSNLFTAALNLEKPWFVSKVDFIETNEGSTDKELHIWLSYPENSLFPCPVDGCEEMCPIHDHEDREWRHLNFFQYKTYIHAPLPRVRCKKDGVKTVDVSWARKGSGFTLLFEGWVVELAKHLPVDVIAKMVGEHDTRLWRFIRHYTDEARKIDDQSKVTKIGMDETSTKGQNYITVVVDLDERRVLFVTEGKDSSTINRFVQDFKEHGGNPERIEIVTCDMALGFRKGINDNFTNSHTIIDKFHVIKHANDAVDKVRKEEAKTNESLKKTKYIWLKNDEDLSDKQRAKKESLMKKHLKTSRAYSMKVELQDIYETSQNRAEAEQHLRKLCSWMMHSRLPQMKQLCGTIRNHWEEILNYFDTKYTNAILEGMNSIIQNVKRRARGFRNTAYFQTMIYLVCGKLDYNAVINVHGATSYGAGV